jgi:hypothetical protein
MTLVTLQTSMAVGTILLAVAGCSKPTPEPSVPASVTETSPAATPAAARSESPLAAGGTAQCPGCAENFAIFDSDTNQRISLQEFLARPHANSDPEAVFRARDGNGDGSLTVAEFCSAFGAGGVPGDCTGSAATAGAERRPGMGMGRGDGSISEQEFTALPHPPR